MKKIYLSLKDLDLGYIKQTCNGINFVANEIEINKAKEIYPEAMKFFHLNEKGEQGFENIPMPFSKFLISNERKDLLEKAGIVECDDEFERLFKLSKLEMMEIIFKIHT